MDAIDAIPKLKKQVEKLRILLNDLKGNELYQDKLEVLNKLSIVQDFVTQTGPVQEFLKNLTPKAEFAIKSVIAIGQAHAVFCVQQKIDDNILKKLIGFLEHLLDLEVFYHDIGGIIGYHLTVIKLILNHLENFTPSADHIRYIHPEGFHLDNPSYSLESYQFVRWGIESLPSIAMIYPLGGSGDRLNLKDEINHTPLPAALLPFLGRTLLEGIIRDTQAKEYLFFKLFQQQITIPIAIMTSVEKDNHLHILNICKNNHWFGRSSGDFHFFIQPLVPVITVEGQWSVSEPLMPTLKPCGHGVLWKLANEKEVFKWLENQGRHKCVIRQINNPLADTDQGLIALIGIGCHQHKSFGFLSCKRLLNSDEGTNVLIESKTSQGYAYCLTNIEYTEFAQRSIGEIPENAESCFSIYPTNTNILFADIASIREALKICSIPGKLINMKLKVPYINSEGKLSHISGGRLECTMQNIADYIIDHFPHQLDPIKSRDALRAYILYSSRSKTISTTKKSYKKGESFIGTPEQAFYDLLSNHYKLLKECQFHLPDWKKIEEYLLDGPSCIFLFHPGLGPLYSIISQKIRKGNLSYGSELQLEIAEVDIQDLNLEGSLLITSTSPLGKINATSKHLKYGQESRCTLRSVTIQNRGIDRQTPQHYWKNTIARKEEVKILLQEGSEFYAENIHLKGSHCFEVPAYHRLILRADSKGQYLSECSPIEKFSWYWRYTFDSQNYIRLEKVEE